MFCRYCGKEIPEGAKFCVGCGREVSAQDNSGQNAQQPQNFQAGEQQSWPNPPQIYPMKWFKFIIYFQLFASAVLMAISAIVLITGAQYEGAAELVYLVCPPLKAVDVIYGIVCIAITVCAILIRQRLAHYVKGAPALYIGFTAVVMASSLVYLFAAMGALSTVSSDAVFTATGDIVGTVMGTLIGAAIFLPLNYVYFKKRRELFVN
ncbi:zinc ribbon domain-containing protein [Clostridium sp. Marseille-P3244]|uniref:zinc ribbon domain-containing protein n=1 Tax=Clostridium sp. Marseille-P3244 TaxID=1871020 RepID=UPI000931CE3A|nr:zinc ribbon domain-containing protein [Clostridium sp. Marseille-P3244]